VLSNCICVETEITFDVCEKQSLKLNMSYKLSAIFNEDVNFSTSLPPQILFIFILISEILILKSGAVFSLFLYFVMDFFT
jgi:hypothetical protein